MQDRCEKLDKYVLIFFRSKNELKRIVIFDTDYEFLTPLHRALLLKHQDPLYVLEYVIARLKRTFGAWAAAQSTSRYGG